MRFIRGRQTRILQRAKVVLSEGLDCLGQMLDRGKVTGKLLVHLRAYAVKSHGEEVWQSVVSQLPAGDQQVLNQPLISGIWYPAGVWNRALDLYLSQNYANVGRAMTTLAQYIAAQDLSTIFKLILKLGSPEFVLSRTDSLYNRYFDTGTWTPKKVGDRHWHCTLQAPRNEDVAPNQLTCTEGICAWNQRALELTGARARVEQVRCRFGSALACEYEMTW